MSQTGNRETHTLQIDTNGYQQEKKREKLTINK